jgi:hypothetical protein
MFVAEAHRCARLVHPNVVPTYDAGVDEVGYRMAMDYLDGVSPYAATATPSVEQLWVATRSRRPHSYR